jgi:geranylgeranyl diphosphate synthase type II
MREKSLSQESFADYLSRRKRELDSHLESYFAGCSGGLQESMRYSLFLPSKRIRPLICLETCLAVSGSDEAARAAAAALEMVHTYSLVHDDLPAMDDDDLRRGMPTNHIRYGQARAILAGDALLTKAFELLAFAPVSESIRIRWVKELSQASGMNGMVLGQDLDIWPDSAESDPLQRLERLHRNKTGKLLAASVVMGAMAGGASVESESDFREFALDLGLAFQIQDDVLDVVGGAEIGKPEHSDEKNAKLTYVSLLGLEPAQREAQKWLDQSLARLARLPIKEGSRLEDFCRFVVNRKV